MPRVLLTAMAASGALVACSPADRAASPVVVASVRQPATSLFFVAQGAGCLAREALTVDERTFELGRDALALLRDGDADVAIAYETPLLRAALVDGRLRVLTKLHTSTTNTRLVARQAASIRAFSDLRGKRIGLARGTNADFFAEVALAAGGLNGTSAVSVDLAPDASVAALARGEIDAAVLSDPYAGQAEQLLGPAGHTLVTNLYTEASLLITREDVLATKQPALRRLVRALACAERAARDDPDRARAIVVARFPEQHAGAIAAQLERVTWGLGLDNVLADVLRREREWLGRAGAADGPDLRQLVHVQLLGEVYPESVTLLPGNIVLRW
ncbi:MAG TPA: ABC transporter substrate-binding protein [Anaeromyxobacter sp.]|nr:ABC transporter substrate-binding protein [Anaeromyxobacter sp.]